MSVSHRRRIPQVIAYSGIGLSLLGLADSIYLTIAHFSTAQILACPENSFINCDKVTSSQYSGVLGIPIVFFGLAFFIGMLILQLPKAWSMKQPIIQLARIVLAGAGLLSVLWLVFVEFHRLHAICLYCSGVHILTFLLFCLTLVGESLVSNEPEEIQT